MNRTPQAPNKQRMKRGGIWIGLLCFPVLLFVFFATLDKSTPGLSGTYATLEDARKYTRVCEYYESADYVFTVDEKDLDFVVDFIICEDDFVVSVIPREGHAYRPPTPRIMNTHQLVPKASDTIPNRSEWYQGYYTSFIKKHYTEWCFVQRSGVTGEEPYKRFDFEYMGKPYSLFCIAQNEGPTE